MRHMTPKTRHKRHFSASDWHPADVVAAVRKAGWSLRQASLAHGLTAGNLSKALRRSYPAAEERIAAIIGVKPHDIWPSRYHPDGTARKRGAYSNRKAPTGEPTRFDGGVNVSAGGKS